MWLKTTIDAGAHQNIWVTADGEAQRVALDADMFDNRQGFIMPVLLGGRLLIMVPGTPRSLDPDRQPENAWRHRRSDL